MKFYNYFLIVASFVFLLMSCEKDTKNTSRVTYYVDFELNDEPVMTIPLGDNFVDPGVVAMEGENDITSTVTVSGNVNSESVGVYIINYSALNVDGFPSSVSRTVIVYDPNISTNIAGTYTTAEGTHRYSPAVGITDYPGYKATLTELAPGVYQVDDFLAGYYAVRAGYGSSYAMRGYLKLNEDNTLTLLSSFISGWGDSLLGFEGKYDTSTGVIEWSARYVSNMVFNVILTK